MSSSEFDLIAKIAQRIGGTGGRLAVGVGDDAAVTVPDGATATSVDALIDGVHFERELFPLSSIGRKALAAALSDLAAMGAETGEAYTVLGVPPDMDEAQCLEVLEGIELVATETGTTLAGGDVSRSPVLALAMTVVGHAPTPRDLIRRDGASSGQAIAVTGQLGGAAAGWRLLKHPELRDVIDPTVADQLLARQLEPRPQLGAGRALAQAGATAMIDVSDGLGADAGHLAAASGVDVEIDVTRLPLQDGVAGVAAADDADPIDLAAAGGEDYELLAAIPPDRLPHAVAAVEETGASLTEIGATSAGQGRIRLVDAGGEHEIPPGFDHLTD